MENINISLSAEEVRDVAEALALQALREKTQKRKKELFALSDIFIYARIKAKNSNGGEI